MGSANSASSVATRIESLVRLDAHQHFWRFTPADYPWMSAEMQVLKRDWLPEDLRPLLEEQRIDACIAVQARASEAETDFLLMLASQYPWIAAVVGWIDLRADDIEQRLARWLEAPALAGFRHQIQDEADVAAYADDARVRRGMRLIQRGFHRRAGEHGDVGVVGDQVGPHAPCGGRERGDEHDDAQPTAPPPSGAAFDPGDRGGRRVQLVVLGGLAEHHEVGGRAVGRQGSHRRRVVDDRRQGPGLRKRGGEGLHVAAHRDGGDIGAPELLARYERMRRPDVASRTAAVDILNRSLLSDFLPVQGMRGFGLYLLDRIAPLRRAVMREGVEPATQPRLMRGEAL